MQQPPYHPDKGPYVRDLQPGERVTGIYLVQYKQLEPFRDRSRGHFLTLMLADRTGSILARVWEGAPDLAETFAQGDMVKVQGDVELYLDRPQLIVGRLRPAEQGEFDLRDFQPSTAKEVAAMLAAVNAAVGQIADPHLSALVRHFFDDPDFVRRFAEAPAARRAHHAYLGGLLESTTEVLALARAIMDLYPEIDADLLLAGALLHDIGITRAYTWETDFRSSDEGQLVGHLVVGDEMVAAAIAGLADFPAELALRVRHMMVSHRGRLEWGSPRRPQTLEAIALHHVKELSAQVNRFRELLHARPEGEPWTAYDRRLGRSLFAGLGDDLSDEEPGGEE